MGVPKFYRWLSERYPLINQKVTATSRAECDNLYLDMNGIIHNSAHSDDSTDELRLRLTEQQIFTNVFKYLDKLFRLVRPRKLLYMALDGVAPRAKMNQQRQRRFRSAAEAASQLQLAKQRGEVVGDLQPFDSNQITPGTEFMKRLSDALKYFIRRKMKEDSAWQRIKVVLSGSEVPGEGEHKIMLFIRNIKMQANYNPNIRHVLYGLDADLIFLSLVSHEPHFFLLREEVLFGKGGGGGGGKGGDRLPRKVLKNLDEFQLLHISLLRDYLYLEYLPHAQHFHWAGGFDQERLIDDWVFLAYLCGNDFLPHLPTLDIGEGGLDTLFRLYKESLLDLDGWITEYGTLHVRRLEVILRKMGKLEEEVFQQRLNDARDQERRDRRGRRRVQEIAADEEFADADDMKVLQPSNSSPPPTSASPEPVVVLPHVTQDDTGATIKQRYYHDKFPQFYDAGLAASHPELFDTSPVPSTPEEHRRSLVANYLEGLMWIQKYYYQGVPSWKWYFRYRYAPLASDMHDLASIHVSFNLGQPFRPLEQLLGVLPPASRNFLPSVYRDMMVGDSAIADFYPLQFAVDMNGKRNSWEGIALIPFIEERRLLDAVGKLDHSRLSTMEKLRNVRVGDEYIYEHDPHNKDSYPAPLPGFAPIQECQSKVSVWSLPLIPLSSRSIEQAASFAAVAAVSRLTTTPRSAASSSDSSALVDLHVKPLAEYEAQEQAPTPEEGNFIPTVPKGCRRPYPGFPSLLALKATAQLRPIGVDVFGSASRKDTLVLAVQSGEQPSDAQMQFVSPLVGKRVWVEWPYLREAELVSVTDGRTRVTSDGTVTLMPGLMDSHVRECRFHQQKQLSTRGVDTFDVSVLATVRGFTGMRRMDNGSIRKTFESDLTVPAQLIAAHNPAPDERWVEQPPPTLQSSFPLGMTVVYVGPNYYGALATITAHTSTVPGKQQVALSIVPPPPSPPFGQQIARTSRLQFYPSHLVAQSLELHPLVLSKVCSSVYVFPGYGDLGLKLRYSKQGVQVPEYARRVDSWQEPRQKRPLQHVNDRQGGGGGGGAYDSVADSGGTWEYSEKAVALVAAYKKRFPHFFDMLQANPHEYKYAAASLSRTGSAKEGDAVLKEITEWLTTVGTNNLILVPCASQMMADRGVKAVEAESARLQQLYAAQSKQPVPLDNVSLLHLYPPNPAIAWSPTEGEPLELGDRVLSVRSDLSVPLGLRGTVVGIHAKACEVVWDEEFMTGNSLNGRCHHLRGQTLPLTAFINLSKPKILQLSRPQDKAAAKQQARAALSALGGKKAAAAAPPAKPAAAKLVAAGAPHEPRIASKLNTDPASAAAPTAAKVTVATAATIASAAPASAKARPAGAVQSKPVPKPATPLAHTQQPQSAAAAEEKVANSVDAGDELVAMWNKLQEEVKSNNNTAPAQPSTHPSTATAAARPIASAVPSSAVPVSFPGEVEQASALLKQLLHVGGGPSPGQMREPSAVSTAAVAADGSAEAESDDRLASKIAKSKARKAAAASLPSPAAVAAAYTPPMPATAVQPHYLHQTFNTFSQPSAGPGFPLPQSPLYAVPSHGYAGPSHFPTQPSVPISYPQPPPPHSFYPPFGAAPPSQQQQQAGRGRGNAAAAHRGAFRGGRGGGAAAVSGQSLPSEMRTEHKQWQPKPAAAEGGGA